MKLVIVSPYAKPEKGAAVIRTHSLADSFSKNGFKVKIFSPARNAQPSSGIVQRYRGIRDVMQWLWKNPSDLVIGVSPPITHNFFVLLVCKLKGIRFILDAKDDQMALAPEKVKGISKKLKQKAYFFMRQYCYQQADAVTFLTQEDFELEKKRYNLSQPLMVISNGTEPSLFPPIEKAAKAQKRLEWGFTPDSVGIVYAGSLGDEPVIEFLESIKRELPKQKAFVLLVVTNDESRHNRALLGELEKKTKEFEIAEQCKILVNVPYEHMGEILGVCDIAVLPWSNRLNTSLPVKIFDYAAARLPIVAKADEKSPIFRLIEKHQIGFSTLRWQAFSQAIFSLFESPNQRTELGMNGRRMVEKEFTRSKNNQKMVELALELLEDKVKEKN